MSVRETGDVFTQIELSPPHWVLQERQLVNWGSYEGYHTFEPSMTMDNTVTLLTGQSESGKSTLVDAQVSLLYPTGAAFNKASNAGRSDRSDYSYLRGQRGMRSEQGHDEIVFLRGIDEHGEPYPVWGAIVDRYIDTVNGSTLSIAKFMYLPANGTSEDVVKLFAVSSSPMDPRLLDTNRDEPFNVPLIKQVFPDAVVYKQANLFHEDVWRKFGLTESACRLLHRMQASDAPSQLDDIFRKGVLEEPSAVARGRLLVEDYKKFSDNFAAIERTLHRIELLNNIDEKHTEYCKSQAETDALRAINPHRGEDAVQTCENWLTMRVRNDFETVTPEFVQAVEASSTTLTTVHNELNVLESDLANIREQKRGHGGERLEYLTEKLHEAEKTRERIAERIENLQSRFATVDQPFPHSAQEWNTLVEASKQTLDNYAEKHRELQSQQHPLIHAEKEAEKAVQAMREDYDRKKKARTRITKEMAEARELIAQVTGLDTEDLPYVAELMDVDAHNESWRTAMNVVYASLAPILLVDSRYERGFARKISQIPHSSMSRRNWQFVDVHKDYGGVSREGWMSDKLTINDNSPFADWVRARVSDMRSDARCVEHIDDADERTRQVQEDGQIKDGVHGSHGTKGNREIIGFVTQEYLQQLADEIEHAQQEYEQTRAESVRIEQQIQKLDSLRECAQAVQDTRWEEIDAQSADARIEQLHNDIDELRSNQTLAELEISEKAREQEVQEKRKCYAQAENACIFHKQALEATQVWLEKLGNKNTVEHLGLNDACIGILQSGYDGYFGAASKLSERVYKMLGIESISANSTTKPPQLTSMSKILHHLERVNETKITELQRTCIAHKEACESAMTTYIEQFMPHDDRVSADVENYPVFEHELHDLQRNAVYQSVDREYFNNLDKTYKDLLQLNDALKSDAKKITTQMDKINTLLERYPFGARQGRLSIQAQVRDPEAKFITALRSCLADLNAYQQSSAKSVGRCKELFQSCAPVVKLVTQSFDEYASNGHGNANLDARRRSRFFGEVKHVDGSIERITSTGGGSGGYLQELTSFAYGAALMFLLANDNATQPSYATIFLDEALIKADGQYTRRALRVLPGLGFQVVVSAPESKTGEIMPSASKIVVARRNPDTGITTLRVGVLDSSGDKPQESH